MSSTSQSERRLRKEFMGMMQNPTPGLRLNKDEIEKNINQWLVEIEGAKGTLYENETFQLQFKFNDKYPFDSPQVQFVGNIPEHGHVYSNGHICLSILSDEWTPALSVSAVCLSIISMLSNASKKERPPDDMIYVRTCNKNPKKTKWHFHDENI